MEHLGSLKWYSSAVSRLSRFQDVAGATFRGFWCYTVRRRAWNTGGNARKIADNSPDAPGRNMVQLYQIHHGFHGKMLVSIYHLYKIAIFLFCIYFPRSWIMWSTGIHWGETCDTLKLEAPARGLWGEGPYFLENLGTLTTSYNYLQYSCSRLCVWEFLLMS